MKTYKVTFENGSTELVTADDILWGAGVVQFIAKPKQENSIIQIEKAPQPTCCYTFNHIVKVDYLGDENA